MKLTFTAKNEKNLIWIFCLLNQIALCATLLCGLTIDSIVQNFFFPEALTKKSKTHAYMGHLQ